MCAKFVEKKREHDRKDHVEKRGKALIAYSWHDSIPALVVHVFV